MNSVRTVVEPEFEPVTLADVYSHLRLDPFGSPPTHPDDAMLTRHIATARRQVEQMTRRALVTQTLRMTLSRLGGCCAIELLRPPVQRIVAVSYYDQAGQAQSLADSPPSYMLSGDYVPKLLFADGFAWPYVSPRSDAVSIDYVAGYAPAGSPPSGQPDYAANVPSQFKDAILIGVQLLYDQLATDQRSRLEELRESLVTSDRIRSSY